MSRALRSLAPCPFPMPSKPPPTHLGQRPPLSPSVPSRLCLSTTSITISLTPFSYFVPVGSSGPLFRCPSSTASDTLLSATTSSVGPSPVDDGGLLPGTASCISSMTVALASSRAQSDSSVVTDAQICGRDQPNPKANERNQTGRRTTTMDEVNACIGHFRFGTKLRIYCMNKHHPWTENSTAPKILLWHPLIQMWRQYWYLRHRNTVPSRPIRPKDARARQATQYEIRVDDKMLTNATCIAVRVFI